MMTPGEKIRFWLCKLLLIVATMCLAASFQLMPYEIPSEVSAILEDMGGGKK